MARKNIIIISGIAIVFVLLIVYNSTASKPIDWSPTYDEAKTKPLDTKIFFSELSSWFPEQPIKKVYNTFYEYEKQQSLIDTARNSCYLSISNSYKIDKSSLNSLIKFVRKGNIAFISARNFPIEMKETLGFETNHYSSEFKKDSITLILKNTNDSIRYEQKSTFLRTYLKDSVSFKKLGFLEFEKVDLSKFQINDSTKFESKALEKEFRQKEHLNFVGIPFNKGIFYIHTNPEIFTNYQLLKSDNTDYLNSLISYIPKNPIYYNRNFKRNPELSDSSLRFILSQPALKWAWYIGLLGLLFFIIFNSKRRQRIVPEIPQLTNTTTEFVTTMSNLYFESDDINNIVQKKITYFLEHVRSHYHLSTNKLDKSFAKKLAQKSGNNLEETETLVQMISSMKNNHYTTTQPLINLNKKIEAFYKK